MPEIDPDRLMTDLRTLRSFGACGTGVVRPSLSPIDMDARRWLAARMSEAGLEARIDGVGNVFGRSVNDGKALLLGSHSDTQPRGGWLDGAMGVIYALEVARAFGETPETREFAVDIASWVDEEGTYVSFLGSRSFCGDMTPETIAAATDHDGRRLADAIREGGIEGAPLARLEPGRHAAYLEAHIEQGPYLEEAGNRIGVVTAIVGMRNLDIVFAGEQNHAGTTPMARRKDAGVALIALAQRINETFPTVAGEHTVWTIGRVAFDPGAASIVPGRAEMHLQFRDQDEARLDALEAKARELIAAACAAGPVAVSIAPSNEAVQPTSMDAMLQEQIAAAAEAHAPGKWTAMPSAAGHDAMILAGVLPSAMLFVPSIGGVSHDFAEDTAEDDIVLGCRVFADAAASIVARINHPGSSA
ncbi:MAG: Zn-dependent hydrolase [Alphaproteobacteria bacterium]